MKKLLTVFACTVALAGLTARPAQALAVGDADPDYLGAIIPGVPTSPTDEVSYINQLIGMPTSGAGNTTTIGANFFDRSDNTCASLGGCPIATTTGGLVDQTNLGGQGQNQINVQNFTWLLVKYGGETHVWQVAGMGLVTIPLDSNGSNPGGGFSHYALFNPGTVTPDGGTTVGLLGLAMMALGYLRRRIA